MVDKWLELAQRNLEVGDSIEKTFTGHCDRKYGYLLMSRKKLLFVSEEGLFSKKYDLVFSIPYNKLKFDEKGRSGLEVTEVGGKRYDLTFTIERDIVKDGLQGLMASAHP